VASVFTDLGLGVAALPEAGTDGDGEVCRGDEETLAVDGDG
jgi:hypothetical protein